MAEVNDISDHQVRDFYGLRQWVEYGFEQSKNALGWTDFRVTVYPDGKMMGACHERLLDGHLKHPTDAS